MNCTEFRANLQQQLDARVDNLPLEAHDHAEGCAGCADELNAFTALRKLSLSASEQPESPEINHLIRQRVLAKLQPRGSAAAPKRFVQLRWPRVAIAGALSTLIVAAALLLGRNGVVPENELDREQTIEFLVEEHNFHVESAVFQGAVLADPLVTMSRQDGNR